jgi:DnaJ-class molecular chaperone
VDPIVASFTGGAVGVLSMLLLVEVNNVKVQAKSRCVYCSGTGYLPCAQCGTRGKLVARAGVVAPNGRGACLCPTCSGAGKVMCTSCLCTGVAMATEHDPRIDPFV